MVTEANLCLVITRLLYTKRHPKIKLHTQSFVWFERFETLIRKESLFPLHDKRH